MRKNTPADVLARYGNFYRGDDDLFAHCFILRNGHCVLIFQGMEAVWIKVLKAPVAKHRQLVTLLRQPIPAAWSPASYQGYNFVTDPEGPNAKEIAVYGVQPGDTRPPGQYYAAPAITNIGTLVKAIAKVD